MDLSVLLLPFLFIFGLIIVFYLPTKNLYSLFHSLFFKNKSCAITSTTSTRSHPVPSNPGKTHLNKEENLGRVFSTFDKNGDGFITKEELRESLKKLRLFTTEREIEEMFAKMDGNKDGLIEFEEFRLLVSGGDLKPGVEGEDKGIEEEEEEDDGEELKEAFDVFDKDRNGLISAEELGLILRSLGLKEGKKVEDVKEMIRKVDEDGDGMVNFDEFRKMMQSREGLLKQ